MKKLLAILLAAVMGIMSDRNRYIASGFVPAAVNSSRYAIKIQER